MKKFVAIACVALCLSVATITLVEAGNIKGPAQGTTICEARGSVVYHESFFGNEMARVAIVTASTSDALLTHASADSTASSARQPCVA